MKNLKIVKFFYILILFSAIKGCTGKENQMVGRWVMEWNFVNGQGQNNGTTISWTFLKDGTFIQSMELANDREDMKGNWRFEKKLNELIMFYTATQMEVKWTVVKLEKDTMEVNHTIPGFFVERQFIKQP